MREVLRKDLGKDMRIDLRKDFDKIGKVNKQLDCQKNFSFNMTELTTHLFSANQASALKQRKMFRSQLEFPFHKYHKIHRGTEKNDYVKP